MKSYQCPLFSLIALLMALPPAQAQSARTGSVSGRVFNPVTEEYVRNAQVRAVQTGEVAISETGGFYYLSGLPAGEVTLELRYIGYPVVTTKAVITAGATATADFDLLAPGPGTEEEIVQLERFVVSSEREGQAKAIMDQRASMDITHTIASDMFGEDPEGNIGEFLRNVPGVFLNTDSGEVRNVRLGGFDPSYTAVTVDGIELAAADASPNAADTRAPSFEMVSLSSMESLQISRTISADVDANAPAGTINMRSKSAFDRRGTHFAVRAVMNIPSDGATFHKTYGPDDNSTALKIRPGFIAEFSTSIRNKFGFIVNVTESNIYSETHRVGVSYNRSPTVNDPRPELPSSITFRQNPRINRRFATTIRTDWRVTRNLVVGLGLIYNYSHLWNLQRNITFDTGLGTNRATSLTLLGDNPQYSFETTGPATLAVNPQMVSKMGQTITVTPKFEYRTRNFVLDGTASWSASMSWYESLERHGSVYALSSPTASNVRFKVERSGNSESTDYTFTQVSGASVASGATFSKPTLFPNDNRDSKAKFLTGVLNGTLMTRWILPISWKAGLKSREEKRTFDRSYYMGRVSFAGATNWEDYKSPYDFDLGSLGVSFVPLGGGTLFMPSLQAIGRRYLEHPEEFTGFAPTSTQYRTDYYYAKVLYHQNFKENIDAGYLMATSRIMDGRIQFRAGVRWERTETDIVDPDTRSTDEMAAAGYAVNPSTGVASTTEGIDYQFFSRPWKHRGKSYENIFPSASLKYQIMENFTLQLGMSTTIKRPVYSDLMGVMMVNDNNDTISLPNINLKPEDARNYAVRLSYYFRGVGNLVAAVYQNELKNMIQSDSVKGHEYGGDLGAQYPDYTFDTRFNVPGHTRVRSLELGWSQNLGFLGSPFRRLMARFNYTRTYAETTKAQMVPHSINAGVTYDYRKLNLYANCNWTDDFPISSTGASWRRHRTQVDVGGGYKINRTYSLALSVRNIFDAKYIAMQHVPPSDPVLYDCLRVGSVINLSIKGAF